MSQHVYRIRRAFLIPLGVDAFLLLFLFVISLLPQGSTTERLVFAFFFFPSGYLFLECFFRRVTVDEGGIVLRRLWREKRVSWEEITHVGGLSLHRKVYILLTTVKGFFIVSNAYGGFSELTEGIVSRVDPSRAEEEVRLQAGRPPLGSAHIVIAWIAAVFMAGIILIKMLPFMA
ncbi:MAG: PH domain-containing protein [Deltaproteobacteria bacterium]|nr:PH domain-containing protein [Deltaproteobacteria bacterium]